MKKLLIMDLVLSAVDSAVLRTVQQLFTCNWKTFVLNWYRIVLNVQFILR